jgi:hypothetical protein
MREYTLDILTLSRSSSDPEGFIFLPGWNRSLPQQIAARIVKKGLHFPQRPLSRAHR